MSRSPAPRGPRPQPAHPDAVNVTYAPKKPESGRSRTAAYSSATIQSPKPEDKARRCKETIDRKSLKRSHQLTPRTQPPLAPRSPMAPVESPITRFKSAVEGGRVDAGERAGGCRLSLISPQFPRTRLTGLSYCSRRRCRHPTGSGSDRWHSDNWCPVCPSPPGSGSATES